MIKKQSIKSGYSTRHRRVVSIIDSTKSQTTENTRSISPQKTKLPSISNEKRKMQTVSPQKSLFKRNIMMKAIEEKANDYESAIKDHLGILNLSGDSSQSDLSPIIKHKSAARGSKKVKSLQSHPDDLAAIELQESKINNSIRNLDKKSSIKVKATPVSVKTGNKEDKEIKLIQDSLNKINLLLNRILHKPNNKNK